MSDLFNKTSGRDTLTESREEKVKQPKAATNWMIRHFEPIMAPPNPSAHITPGYTIIRSIAP
jgi:hypothetical protein